MKWNAIIRSAVLALIALLAIDASWCCDDISVAVRASGSTMTANEDCSDDAGSLDCHACICSGSALIETTPALMPPMQSTDLPTLIPGHLVSAVTPVDVPPDKRG